LIEQVKGLRLENEEFKAQLAQFKYGEKRME
jgi:hypothetical protein